LLNNTPRHSVPTFRKHCMSP